MFNFFRKAGDKVVAKETPTHIRVRSYGGISDHIVATGGVIGVDPEKQPALCGYDNWLPTNNVIATTPEGVAESLPRQHSNWRWCTGCVEAYL